MKVALLTSSRADFGILKPLIKELEQRKVDIEIIAFGAHCSEAHGKTIDEVEAFTSSIIHKLDTFNERDNAMGIASNYSQTVSRFASFWDRHSYQWVFFVGDRYEMLGAVSTGIFFRQPFAHIHGGEETKGAIDNIFRHSLSHFSHVHFTSTEHYKQRVIGLVASKENAHCVGALSLDDVKTLELVSADAFYKKYHLSSNEPFILITLHPETGALDNGRSNLTAMVTALEKLDGFQYLITQSNADADGMYFRERLSEYAKRDSRVTLVESLGKTGYFSALKHCAFVMGNTSSGLIEAPSFGKFTINIGDRQKGRVAAESVVNVQGDALSIIRAIQKLEWQSTNEVTNPYWKGGAAQNICNILEL